MRIDDYESVLSFIDEKTLGDVLEERYKRTVSDMSSASGEASLINRVFTAKASYALAGLAAVCILSFLITIMLRKASAPTLPSPSGLPNHVAVTSPTSLPHATDVPLSSGLPVNTAPITPTSVPDFIPPHLSPSSYAELLEMEPFSDLLPQKKLDRFYFDQSYIPLPFDIYTGLVLPDIGPDDLSYLVVEFVPYQSPTLPLSAECISIRVTRDANDSFFALSPNEFTKEAFARSWGKAGGACSAYASIKYGELTISYRFLTFNADDLDLFYDFITSANCFN